MKSFKKIMTFGFFLQSWLLFCSEDIRFVSIPEKIAYLLQESTGNFEKKDFLNYEKIKSFNERVGKILQHYKYTSKYAVKVDTSKVDMFYMAAQHCCPLILALDKEVVLYRTRIESLREDFQKASLNQDKITMINSQYQEKNDLYLQNIER